MTLEKIFKILLFSRFEPVETLLAIQSLFTGLILLLPGNENLIILIDNPDVKMLVGIVMLTIGLVHLIIMAMSNKEKPFYELRKWGMLGITSENIFMTIAIIAGRGITGRLEWTAFLFMAMIATIIFINIVHKSLDRGG